VARNGIGNGAWGISDRSGMRFPLKEMLREPGTGYWIHKSESDGIYNAVDHPQNHVADYTTFDDPKPVDDPHPDIDHVLDLFLRNENGLLVTDSNLSPINID